MISTSAIVPEGYKQTDVGVIPKDWRIRKIGDFTNCAAGGTPSTLRSDYWGEGFRWMNSGELNLKVVSDVEGRITPLGLKESSTRLIPPKCILIGLAGQGKTRGTVAINTVELCTNQSIAAIFPNNDFVSKWLYYNLDNRYLELRGMSTGDSGRGGLNLTIIRSIYVAFPDYKEQELIAEVLTDSDSLIQALENLISKKRNIKQGTMQELLTGNIRLPGFSGEWKTLKLKDFLKTPVSDGPHLTPIFHRTGIPFLSVNNLVNNRVNFSELRYISEEDHIEFSKKCKPERNDILLGKAASVGKVAIIDFDLELNIWSPLALIRVNETHDPKFVFYSFQSSNILNQIQLLTNSSSQGNIGMGDIELLIFNLPEKNEQKAIAEVLSDMDAEITALEQRLEKAKAIKQGMMQQLLTGRIRLVDPSTPVEASA
jgi:type I restriction enzyme, S subunit